MDLDYWLGHMYRTAVVSGGRGHEEVKRMFREALTPPEVNARAVVLENASPDPASSLRAEAEAELARLTKINKVRNGGGGTGDYITRMKVKFLEAALNTEENA